MQVDYAFRTFDRTTRDIGAGRPQPTEQKTSEPGQPGLLSRTGAPPRLAPAPGEGILLVEDQEGLRDLVATILRRLGYRLFEAGSVPAAMALWRDHRHEIDLLLTDLVMPDTIDGRELAERLVLEQPDLRVMITSGMENDKVRLKQGHAYLRKPFSAATLRDEVRRCLDQPVQV